MFGPSQGTLCLVCCIVLLKGEKCNSVLFGFGFYSTMCLVLVYISLLSFFPHVLTVFFVLIRFFYHFVQRAMNRSPTWPKVEIRNEDPIGIITIFACVLIPTRPPISASFIIGKKN